MHPELPKSFRNAYPFKICAPSFIYPDDYLPNIRSLGSYMDEIEILCFESDALPSAGTVREMVSLAADMNLTYNVHLPTDIYPGSPDAGVQRHFIETMLRVLERVRPLEASTHTLHLPYLQAPVGTTCDDAWKDRTAGALHRLFESGIPNRCLTIETLDYPLEWVSDILDAFDLKVCLDVGHLMIRGEDIGAAYDRFENRTTLIHLHGVKAGKDHLGLDVLDPDTPKGICSILDRFCGTVSLEVFSYVRLVNSLNVLERWIKG